MSDCRLLSLDDEPDVLPWHLESACFPAVAPRRVEEGTGVCVVRKYGVNPEGSALTGTWMESGAVRLQTPVQARTGNPARPHPGRYAIPERAPRRSVSRRFSR